MLALALASLLLIFTLRQSLAAVAIEWILKQSVGLETKVRVLALGPQSAEIDLWVAEPKIHWPSIRIQWWFRGWLPLRLEALAGFEGKSLKALGAEISDLNVSLRATVNGRRLESFFLAGKALSVEHDKLVVLAPGFSLARGVGGLKARLTAKFPWGKTEARFDGAEANLPGVVEGKGRFQLSWAKERLSGGAAFHFDSAFHSGTAHLDDIRLLLDR